MKVLLDYLAELILQSLIPFKARRIQVTAGFMRNWEDDDGVSRSVKEDFMDAAQVADKLSINLVQMNFAQKYKEKVFSYFLEELIRKNPILIFIAINTSSLKNLPITHLKMVMTRLQLGIIQKFRSLIENISYASHMIKLKIKLIF